MNSQILQHEKKCKKILELINHHKNVNKAFFGKYEFIVEHEKETIKLINIILDEQKSKS